MLIREGSLRQEGLSEIQGLMIQALAEMLNIGFIHKIFIYKNP